jgi:cell wall-associated NlpC family hydrolase
MNKQDIVNKAREYIDTPFVHQGRMKNVGVDCAGLCVCVLTELGLILSDVKNYKRIPDGNVFADTVNKNLTRKDNMEVGDFLIFAFDSEPQHIAIVSQLNPLKIIHSYQKVGKVVEHNAGRFWEQKIRGCFEIKKESN